MPESPAVTGARETEDTGPLVVWRISDGRPGHDKQSLGLVEALARRTPVRSERFVAPGRGRGFVGLLLGRAPVADGRQGPGLVVGAGHSTHPSLLATRRAFGCPAVVLMRPSLPTRWFDLCFVPEHDHPREAPNVISTVGVLNRVVPGPTAGRSGGLVLVGGPSRHHGWDGAHLLEQVAGILDGDPRTDWTVADSPRTPRPFREDLHDLCFRHGIPFRSVPETEPDWLDRCLPRRRSVWVGEDSISMVYEALTAGAAVGLLEMPRRRGRRSRVVRGVEGLVETGRVVPYGRWVAGGRGALPEPAGPLAEADRCAREILARMGERSCA